MARIDDYTKALELATNQLKEKNIHHVSKMSGTRILEVEHTPCLEVPFMDRMVRIIMPEGAFSSEERGELPIQEKILILHYLNNAQGSEPTGDWITYREAPGGEFYYSAFVKRAVNPFKSVFGENPETFERVAPILKGEAVREADVAFSFLPLPLVPLKLLLWKGDDEFPPEGNVLFDRTVSQFLSVEDMAWLAGMVVYKLIGLSKAH